jgi:hypothetical protein
MYLHDADCVNGQCRFGADTAGGFIVVAITPLKMNNYGRLEEVMIHEGAHISIDTMWQGPHFTKKNEAYEEAKELDARILSYYAGKDIRNGIEDVAVSYTAWVASKYKPNVLTAA